MSLVTDMWVSDMNGGHRRPSNDMNGGHRRPSNHSVRLGTSSHAWPDWCV